MIEKRKKVRQGKNQFFQLHISRSRCEENAMESMQKFRWNILPFKAARVVKAQRPIKADIYGSMKANLWSKCKQARWKLFRASDERINKDITIANNPPTHSISLLATQGKPKLHNMKNIVSVAHVRYFIVQLLPHDRRHHGWRMSMAEGSADMSLCGRLGIKEMLLWTLAAFDGIRGKKRFQSKFMSNFLLQ